MGNALTIFKAINSDSDKQVFARKIVTSQESIPLMTKSQQPLILHPKDVDGDNNLHCTLLDASLAHEDIATNLTINIIIQGESYMFETRPVIVGQDIKLPIFNLFHLQKRKNYRYVIPEGYSAEFIFSKLNDEATSLKCPILDLSTEGCAIEIPADSTNVKLNDTLEGMICLGNKEPIAIQGSINNIRAKGDSKLILGLQLRHLTNASENLIITSLIDLQREVYFRTA